MPNGKPGDHPYTDIVIHRMKVFGPTIDNLVREIDRLGGDTPELRAFIDRLSVPQRLELVGLIWDSIADSEAGLPVPEWHIRELERRRAAADANPEAGVPWEEVKARFAQSRNFT